MLPEPKLAELNLGQKIRAAKLLLEDVLGGAFGPIAVVSSFGADSAVLLHLVSEVNRDTPVIFLDTRMLFQETLDYQLALTRQFGLSDVRRIIPETDAIRRGDVFGRLHLKNAGSCCDLRKVQPLEGALKGFDGWITGRKRHQTADRAVLDFFEIARNRLKINPLALWERADIEAYFSVRNLPRHPLSNKGYASLGCAPCTTPVSAGENPRAGRWRGSDRAECGIHFDATGSLLRPAA